MRRRLSRAVARVLLLVLAALTGTTLSAQRAIDWSTKPVFLMTMGQGTEVFEKFGHNALVVWDDVMGQPLVYNYGLFDFAQPNFIGRFLTGDTKYAMGPNTLEGTMQQYRYLNRTVTIQELHLTPTQKRQLVQFLATNALEQNKYYRYDYYRDNCSTRVRDALDGVTGGALSRALKAQPGRGSYRWHTRRLLAYSAPLYFGSELVLGVDADAPLTGWQEAFLPEALAQAAMRIELPAADGMPTRPLASAPDTLFVAARDVEPRTVSPRIGLAAVLGVAIGTVLLGLARMGKLAAGIGMMLWGVFAIVTGTILLLAWFATRHVFMANNPSVALLNPVWVVAVIAGVLAMRGGVPRALRSALRWLLVIAVIGTAGAVLSGHAVSALELAALVLPAHAAVVYSSDRYKRVP